MDERASKIPQASQTNSLIKNMFKPTTTIATWHFQVSVLQESVNKSKSLLPILTDTYLDSEYNSATILEDSIDSLNEIQKKLGKRGRHYLQHRTSST